MSLAALIAAASDHHLPGVFGSLEPTLQQWGYLAVGGFLFLEDFGVPLPGETMLIAAALYAGAGHLNIVAVAVVAFVAAVAGDNIGYLIGRAGGRRVVERFGRFVFLTPSRLDRAEHFFNRHGAPIVVVARFIEGLRQLNGIIAGTIEMRWLTFVTFQALGAALWVAVWSSLGYVAGDHVETISRYLGYVVIGVVVIAAAVIAHRVRRRRRRRREAPASGRAQPEPSAPSARPPGSG